MPRVRTALGRWWVIAAYASLAAFASVRRVRRSRRGSRQGGPGEHVGRVALDHPADRARLSRAGTRVQRDQTVGGSGVGAAQPVLVELIRNLDPMGRPVIRIGGLSTDHSWWPVPGMKAPLGHHLHPHPGVVGVAPVRWLGRSTGNSYWGSTWRPTAPRGTVGGE